MTSTLELAPRLDYEATGALYRRLCDCRGAPLTLDAGAVSYLGALALQLLIAARAQWQRDGEAFAILPRSDAFCEAVVALGLPAEFFGAEAER